MEESLLFHGVSTVKGKKKEKGSLELSRLYNKEGLLHVLISSEANIISNQVKKQGRSLSFLLEDFYFSHSRGASLCKQ
uniref:Uncharacterized protein n=1 Tax=Aegilops tauschii subsp. strangulata TaxID=200361 RepID=A0A453DRK7_AEGTS